MEWNRLHGEQYVRLAPDAVPPMARYLGVAPEDIDELVVDIPIWPAEIRPLPLQARDGRLMPGDPLLLAVTGDGLVFAGRSDRGENRTVLVRWDDVAGVRFLEKVAVG